MTHADDLNDADVLPRISDHDPNDRLAAEHDQIRRDGQRWAAGLVRPAALLYAQSLANSLTKELMPERRAFCEGVRDGLTIGYRGLTPDNGRATDEYYPGEFETHDCVQCGAGLEYSHDTDTHCPACRAEWDTIDCFAGGPTLTDCHAKALVGLPNTGDFGQGVVAFNIGGDEE